MNQDISARLLEFLIKERLVNKEKQHNREKQIMLDELAAATKGKEIILVNQKQMNQDSKEFFKLVSSVSQEQAIKSAVIGRQLQMRWLENKKDNPLVVHHEAFVAEILDKTEDTIFCKLDKTHKQGVNTFGWFTVKEFVSTFQICFYTKWNSSKSNV